MEDNRESEQNRYSLFTVRDAENAMTAFTIFAIAIIFGVFFHALIIEHKLLITLNSIVSSLSAVVSNVSNVLSASTLLTILLEGADIMFFRRTREERAKLKQERRELEKLKKEIQDLQSTTQKGPSVSEPVNVKANTRVSKQPAKPENTKPNK